MARRPPMGADQHSSKAAPPASTSLGQSLVLLIPSLMHAREYQANHPYGPLLFNGLDVSCS
jgi:hypothetical protein